MKKVFSVLLAVMMLVTFGCFQASAADEDLLKNGVDSNNTDHSTVTTTLDGGYEAVVTTAWDSTTDAGYGFAISPALEGVDMTGKYVHLSITSDTPFRISQLDRSGGVDKWIVYSGEFFNTVIPNNVEGPGTAEMLVNEKFFPAGTYECVAYLGGVYDWKTNDGQAGWDIKNADVTAIYIEAMEAGTMKLNSMTLSDSGVFGEGSTSDVTTTVKGDDGDSATKAPPTKAPSDGDNKNTGANTGEHSKVALFVMMAVVASTAVTLCAVSAKAKNR